MMALRLKGAGISLALALAVPLAHGQTPATQAALEYHPGPGCPDEASFRARVEARTPGVLAPSSSRTLRVTLEGGEEIHGRLVLATGGGLVVRDVSGANCDEVASALAIIAAVLLEGDAVPEEPAPPPAQPAPADGLPPETPPPLAPPIYPQDRTVPPAPPPGTPDGPPVRVQWALGAQALLGGGVGPAVAAGGRFFGEAAIANDETAAASPSLRLSVAWYPGTEVDTSGGRVRFSQLTGRLELCPVRLRAGELSLSPCALLDAGSLSAGKTEPSGSAEGHLWLAPGALARVAFFFGSVVGVELEGGITVPLDRYRFFFTPGPFVYQVPSVVGSGGVGLVLRFR